MKWNESPHQLSVETALEILGSNPETGLTKEAAKQHLETYGFNRISTKKGTTAWMIFLNQFTSILIWILIFAGLVSFLMGDKIEGFAILFVIILNAFLGFFQEYRADQSVKAIANLVSPMAKVIRDGIRQDVKQEELVPGDVVCLEAGDKIPADLRIIDSFRLTVDESMLTGESVTVQKNTNSLDPTIKALGDRKNMAFMGTILLDGRGKGLVVQTGKETELGKIAELTQEMKEQKTPLEQKLQVFSKNLTIILGFICAVIFAINLVRSGMNIKSLQDTFLFAISLAVAAIPESLPAVTTIVLSTGVNRMSKQKAVIKKLSSVETLGSTTVICTDKTGTLTENKMKTELICTNQVVYSTQQPFKNDLATNRLLEVCYFANDSDIEDGHEYGDPTEIALLQIALGLDEKYRKIRRVRLDEIPFDSNRKMMSTIHRVEDTKMMYTKGAFEEISQRCTTVILDDKIVPFDAASRKFYTEQVLEWSQSGYRVLAVSCRENPSEIAEEEMTFVGLAAMRDPIRIEVFDAIKTCKEAGIRVIMLTGDHLETAKAYARELQLTGTCEEAFSHNELENMTDDELIASLKIVSVFARITPEDKYRVVSLLKEQGEIVAMTGDGVNDAPALRKADIGVAMGIRGTDLSREVSELVLLDDNFATIVNAVKEGRVIYDNIKKTIFFLLSCNMGEILLVVATMLMNLKMPLGALHLLWLNLITDSFPALALGFEEAEKNIMIPRKSKQNDFINARFLTGIMLQAFFISGGALWLYMRHLPEIELQHLSKYLTFLPKINMHYAPNGIEEAMTVCFAGIIVIELLRAMSARSQQYTLPEIGFWKNKSMIFAQLFSFSCMLIALYGPLALLFNSRILNWQQWIEIGLVSLIVLIFAELSKFLFRKKPA
jgi:Ca2+-transporting ATPase